MRENQIAATEAAKPGDLPQVTADFSRMVVRQKPEMKLEPAPPPVVEPEEQWGTPAPSWSPDSPEFGIMLVKTAEVNGRNRAVNTRLVIPFDVDAHKAAELIGEGFAIREPCLTVRCLSGFSYPHADYAGRATGRVFKGRRGELLLYLGRPDDHLLRMAAVEMGVIEILHKSIGTGRYNESLDRLHPCPKPNLKRAVETPYDPRSPILAAHQDILNRQAMQRHCS
jgi:hypothetical protein